MQEQGSASGVKAEPNAPEGWPFEAEGTDTQLPSDIEALLSQTLQQPEQQETEGDETNRQGEVEYESSMIFGEHESAQDLQALPKVVTCTELVLGMATLADTSRQHGMACRDYPPLPDSSVNVNWRNSQFRPAEGCWTPAHAATAKHRWLPREVTACSQSQRELQDKLAQRGLPKSGNKAELAQRLHEALVEEQDMFRHEELAVSELTRQFRESMMGPGSRSLLCPCIILTMCRKQA